MSKLPKIIYVQREEDGPDSYLLANEKLEDTNDGKVYIYELKETKIKKTITTLE